MLHLLADAAVPPGAYGVIGLCGAAAIAGWFSVRANRQEHGARVTKTEAVEVKGDVAEVLDIVRDLLADNKRLQKALDDCRRSRRS